MINRLKALFVDREGRPAKGAGGHSHGELELAAAALLVEAASMDADFDQDERDTVEQLLRARFELNDEELAELMHRAERTVAASVQLLPFTRVIKDRFSYEERVELIEMLWEVAYADGTLDDFEAHLLRRVGGLIYVSDKDRGAARKRVMARLGIAEDRPSA